MVDEEDRVVYITLLSRETPSRLWNVIEFYWMYRETMNSSGVLVAVTAGNVANLIAPTLFHHIVHESDEVHLPSEENMYAKSKSYAI